MKIFDPINTSKLKKKKMGTDGVISEAVILNKSTTTQKKKIRYEWCGIRG